MKGKERALADIEDNPGDRHLKRRYSKSHRSKDPAWSLWFSHRRWLVAWHPRTWADQPRMNTI